MIVPDIVCQHQLASLSRIKKPVRSLNLTKLQEQIDRLERHGVAKAEPDDALTLGVAVIDKHSHGEVWPQHHFIALVVSTILLQLLGLRQCFLDRQHGLGRNRQYSGVSGNRIFMHLVWQCLG